jgi:GNAT superfamily N-acetyltransferase
MNIREANSEDNEAICHLLTLLFEQEAEFKPDFATQSEGVGEILSDPEKGRFFVIEDSGRIVGCVSLLFLVSTALGGKAALLEDLVVAKPVRGQGWGTQLLDHAIQQAIQNGCKRITVLTDKDNSAAQSIYQKMGFDYSEMIPMRLVFKIPPDPPYQVDTQHRIQREGTPAPSGRRIGRHNPTHPQGPWHHLFHLLEKLLAPSPRRFLHKQRGTESELFHLGHPIENGRLWIF